MSIATTSFMDDTDERYTVSSRLEIQSLLRDAQKKNALLRMHVKGRSAAIITTILDIEGDTGSLVVDNSSDEGFNQRIVSADTVSFETLLDKVRVIFSSNQVSACMHDNRPALRLPIPDSLTRIQRREFYRVETPVTNPPRCTFMFELPKGPGRVSLEVRDVSAGGICVLDNQHQLDNAKGTLYPACELSLPDVGQVITDLRIVRSVDEEGVNGKERRLLGCKFVALPSPMQMRVQHYIGMLERRLNAKRRGFE